MRRKIMKSGIHDVFDVFMLLTLVLILSLEWFGFSLEGWRRIGCAVIIAALGALAGREFYSRFFRR
jgi:hypothetical protein